MVKKGRKIEKRRSRNCYLKDDGRNGHERGEKTPKKSPNVDEAVLFLLKCLKTRG